MIFLLLSILSSTIIAFLFKWFVQYKVQLFPAIVFNYITCVTVGSLSLGQLPITANFWEVPWFPYAIGLGILFISGFYLIGLTVQYFGATLSTIMQKMSMVISTAFAIYWYGEAITLWKVLGILIAIVAIWLSNQPTKNTTSTTIKNKIHFTPFLLALPLIIFLTSGIVECILQYVQQTILDNATDENFIVFIFGTAGCIGSSIVLINVLMGRIQVTRKEVIAGICLGIPNYASIYFLMESLSIGWGGSVIFPINNVGIIVATAVGAFLLFRERLSLNNKIGVAFAILSIVLIAIG